MMRQILRSFKISSPLDFLFDENAKFPFVFGISRLYLQQNNIPRRSVLNQS